jgi:tRNA(fMet)-specific endonuclease VapC
VILLDTNHVSILKMPPSDRRARLVERMTLEKSQTFAIPIVAVEETMRGWLAAIAKERQAVRQVFAYRELSGLFEFFASFPIAAFDRESAKCFEALQVAKIRIATRDLKIASTALANNALLLTANRRDFEKVPGLRFENWLE